MTVTELIEHLTGYPGDMPILLDFDGEFREAYFLHFKRDYPKGVVISGG